MTHTRFAPLACFVLILLGLGGCAGRADMTLEIKPSGEVILAQEMDLPRAMVEQMARMQDGGGEVVEVDGQRVEWQELDPETGTWKDADATPPADAQAADAPDAQAEPEEAQGEAGEAPDLAQRLRQQIRRQRPQAPGVTYSEVDVEVGEEKVTVRQQITFESLEAFASQFANVMQMPMMAGLRLDKTDAGNLRLTLGSGDQGPGEDEMRMFQSQMLSSGFQGTFTIIMPGKIVESSFPQTEENRTTITVEPTQQSVEKLVAIIADEMVFVAEPGELDLSPLPLSGEGFDPMARMRQGREAEPQEQLPLQEAEGDYFTEVTTVQIRRVHKFEEGQRYREAQRVHYMRDEEGCKLSGRLFAPQGQRVLEIRDVTVEEAVDDQGNSLKAEAGDGGRHVRHVIHHGGEGDGGSTPFNLQLQVPGPEAQAIDQVRGTMEVIAFEGWTEHRIEDLAAQLNKPIDLSELVPGATMTIEKVRRRPSEHGQVKASVVVEGPPQARQIEVFFGEASRHGRHSGGVHAERLSADRVRRQFTVEWWPDHFGPDGEPVAGDALPALTARIPEGLRREKVTFELGPIDLY